MEVEAGDGPNVSRRSKPAVHTAPETPGKSRDRQPCPPDSLFGSVGSALVLKHCIEKTCTATLTHRWARQHRSLSSGPARSFHVLSPLPTFAYLTGPRGQGSGFRDALQSRRSDPPPPLIRLITVTAVLIPEQASCARSSCLYGDSATLGCSALVCGRGSRLEAG